MTKEQIETQGWTFETRGDAVFVVARFWVEEFGPFDSDDEACAAMVVAYPTLLDDEA